MKLPLWPALSLLLVANACALPFSPPPVSSVPVRPQAFPALKNVAAQRFMIKLKPSTERDAVRGMLQGMLEAEAPQAGLLIARPPSNGAIEHLLYRPEVKALLEYVEPDWPIASSGCEAPAAPDLFFDQLPSRYANNAAYRPGPLDAFGRNDLNTNALWGLKRIQAASPSRSDAAACVSAASTGWGRAPALGAGVRVAVLDTGIDATHPDLDAAGHVAPGVDFVSNDEDPTDDNGHGTHVAGILAGELGNVDDAFPGADAQAAGGIVGVAPHCTIVPVKVLAANGAGSYSAIVQGLDWASDPGKGGAKVINLSLTGPEPSRALEEAIQRAWERGVLVVAAAGNTGSSALGYPAAYEPCLAVGASDVNDRRARFSAFGEWVDMWAPGVDIWSSAPVGLKRQAFERMSGTSMASPLVAGVAALLWAEHPDWTVKQVRDRLLKSADLIADLSQDWVSGRRLNAYRALQEP